MPTAVPRHQVTGTPEVTLGAVATSDGCPARTARQRRIEVLGATG